MEELLKWLDANKICYKTIDKEVVEIVGFGKMFLADLSEVHSIFRGTKEELQFNLMEHPGILMDEGINYVAFPFGKNWYYYDLREEFRFNILKYIGKRQEVKRKTPFVNLGIHTPYELLNGSGDLSLWVKKAKLLGHTAIGICDRNTMAATLSLQKECAKAGIRHVFGYSFTMKYEGEKVEMKVYCQSQQGLKNLLRIQKEVMVDSSDNTIGLDKLLSFSDGNVLVFGKFSSFWIHEHRHLLNIIKEYFAGNLYYQVDLTEYKADRIDAQVLKATGFYFSNFYDRNNNEFLIEPVLICDNYYLDKDDARNKLILNKIASGAAHNQSEEQYFKDIDEHYALIESTFNRDVWDIDALFERLCGNTVKIAAGAQACYELGKMHMPRYIMLEEEEERYGDRRSMFLGLLEEGLIAKIDSSLHEIYRERLEEEVYIIESTNNVDYFLIQWDMIKEAKRRGIATGIGRGSAGGSLVSYLLDIISIDPIKYDLLFSRFLVPERCGLNWVEKITILKEEVHVPAWDKIVSITIEGNPIQFHGKAKLLINRENKKLTVTADNLKPGDEIIFDNRDLLWTLNKLFK